MPKRIVLITATLLVLIGFFAGAQENPPDESPFTPQIRTNQRSLGDQTFTISAGLYVPLFTVLLNDYGGYDAGAIKANLKPGGAGSLAYSFYLSPNWKLGLQFSGSFAKDINGNFAYTIPINVKGTYEFHPGNRITVPLHLGVGIAMSSWRENFIVDPILRPGAGVYFDWNFEWSFGMDISWWFIPQLTADDKSENSIGNFMDITLSAEYHF